MALEMLSRQSLRRLEENIHCWKSNDHEDLICLHSEVWSLGPSVCQGWTDLHRLLSNRFLYFKSKDPFMKPWIRLGQNVLPPICCRWWSWGNPLLWGQNAARGQRSRDIWRFAYGRINFLPSLSSLQLPSFRLATLWLDQRTLFNSWSNCLESTEWTALRWVLTSSQTGEVKGLYDWNY